MKLATLLASIVPLLFMATNVGADLGHTLGPVGDVPIQMPGPDNPGEKVVHTKPNPSITSPGPNSTSSIGSSPIKNHCGVDGVVPHSYMVTLKSPLPSDSVPTSAGLNTNMGDLSFLKGWFQKYTPDTSKPGPPNPDSAHALHYFMQTQLAVAIEASDDVCGTPSTRPSRPSGPFLCAAPVLTRSHMHTPHQVAMSIANDPAVSSVESDCYRQVDASLPKSGDSSPDLYEVARRLSVQADAPWGIDRIDTDGEPAVRSWRQQHHHRAAMALASRTAAPACNSAPE
jgi:hypothetical protein